MSTVRAAGCVVWRLGDDDLRRYLVVHRPRYDDWSLAKGKLDPGETEAECAVRETEEEAGVRGVLGPEVGLVEYVDHKGRPKTVRYWALAATEVGFEPNDEVDRIDWLRPDEAVSVLSYDHDRDLVRDTDRHLDSSA